MVQLHVFFTISNGVRQGGILSPKIFALYMNGLTDELSNSYAGCYINDKCINHIMYADDSCLMAPTGTAMQNLLDVCHNYGAANDILFNPLKYVCIVYKPKNYKLCCPSVNIGSEPLRFVNETKYLGFTYYARSNRILRMFSHCSIDVKIVLFNIYCTPLYCSYLWTEYKKSSFSKIRVAFNNAYRRISLK